MRKLTPFLAIVLMAGPALVAFGVTGTYTDDFNGANPGQYWGVQDEAGHVEWWTPAGLATPDRPEFTVSYGGMAHIVDGDANPASPLFLGSILTDGAANVVQYTNATGGVTVHGRVNAGSLAIGHPIAIAAMFHGDAGGFDFYTMNISPWWHNISLGCYENTMNWFRLANWDQPGSPPAGQNMWTTPIDLTMQVQPMPNGNISFVGLAYGDIGGGYQQLCALSCEVGATQPDQYQIGGVAQPLPDPSLVPKLTAGGVGFGGGFAPEYAALGNTQNVTFDDYASWIPLPGDSNLDGTVDLLDLGVVGDNWNAAGTGLLGGDSNFDGVVDLLDLGAVGDHWNASAFAEGAPSSVPEPSTLTLLVLGAVAAILCRRLRSSL